MQAQLKAQQTGAAARTQRSVAVLRPVAPRSPCFQAAPSCSRAQRSATITRAKVQLEEDEKLQLSGEMTAEQLKLPHGYHWYETMIILKPTLSDEDRDKELAKFEAFLNKEDCKDINALVRGRSRLAYPIKTHWEGCYVLYTYAAKRQTARTVQLLLSTPEAGSEDTVLRHITFCKN